MLKIIDGEISNFKVEAFSYIKTRGFASRLILAVTRWFRSVNVEKYINRSERQLDLGCGDGYFLKRSKCRERFGLDKLLGDNIEGKLDFPDNYFDYVTLIAVIEHISHPEQLIIEIRRILKTGGRLIITTPKKTAEKLIKLYVKDIEGEHVRYYDREKMIELTKDGYALEAYHVFLFGLNQVFCFKKHSKYKNNEDKIIAC
ncbi:MAG TPA: methyltransferase domain-containing protein [Candidatus Omnitrophica bacterium]|nr:methyltransferase domain-containing protein [Candidatus Omnitrophota bacterium]